MDDGLFEGRRPHLRAAASGRGLQRVVCCKGGLCEGDIRPAAGPRAAKGIAAGLKSQQQHGAQQQALGRRPVWAAAWVDWGHEQRTAPVPAAWVERGRRRRGTCRR